MRKLTIPLLALILITTATATEKQANQPPEVKHIDPWPDQIEHHDSVYVDTRIVDEETEVEEARLIVRLENRKLVERNLFDSNSDSNYSSLAAFSPDGDSEYSLEVEACDTQDSCTKKTKTVEAACNFKVAEKCFY